MHDIDKLSASLTENTLKVYEKVSKLDCIKNMYLCGGTAQSLQMQHRKSEDLDFEIIGISKERPELQIGKIFTEVKSVFPEAKREYYSDSHIQIFVGDNVKLSFFRPKNSVPILNTGYTFNNIKTPTLDELLGMKIFLTSLRLKYRDYYDIYCLVKDGHSLLEGIDYACKFSRHEVKSKTFLMNLTTAALYEPDINFELLDAKYNVTPQEIQKEIENKLIKERNELKPKEIKPKKKIIQFKF